MAEVLKALADVVQIALGGAFVLIPMLICAWAAGYRVEETNADRLDGW